MQARIEQLSAKESNLREHYQNRVVAAILKNKYDERLQLELSVMVAEQFGLEEQLYSLRHNIVSKKRQTDFVNSLAELDYSNYEIETLVQNADYEYLPQKYKIDALPPTLQTVFRKNNKKFVKILKEFVDKRNLHRKKPNDKLLEELVLLKSNLIKHLCVMEKCANVTQK
ncbi:PKIP-1 [Alphabaculovirus myunipunctae]|uniref:PKIP-1 n=1 Tax=Mythimna unipuncta nucleopolyhedrovirus TaxID=447897 RepID=A0A2K9VS59_9ABAC|nr:PKIP-1 [Mythimna unipuncta nucleopolyhedrovirus]AUV65289.1 PKIP-1 [Mythimna unipuncta nucleopolyhedrovirus]